MVVVLIIASCLICAVVYSIGLLVACWVFSVQVERIKIFIGPTVNRRQLKRAVLEIGSIPLSIDLKINLADFDRTSTAGKVAIRLGGIVALVQLGGLLMWSRAFPFILSGCYEIVLGAISPFDHGQHMAEQSISFLTINQFPVILGAVACKIIAYNLLPTPALPIGQIIFDLIRSRRDSDDHSIPLIFLIPIVMTWAIAAIWAALLVTTAIGFGK